MNGKKKTHKTFSFELTLSEEELRLLAGAVSYEVILMKEIMTDRAFTAEQNKMVALDRELCELLNRKD